MQLSLFMLWVLLSISCTKEPLSNPTGITQQYDNASVQTISHYIGERFGGGIVFYVTADNHGLIADSVDLPVITWWDGKFKTTGARATSIGSGKSNTKKIVSAQDVLKNFAALECYNSTRGGKHSVFRHAGTEVDFCFIVEDTFCCLIINVKPELKLIKVLLPIALPSSPAIANTFVMRNDEFDLMSARCYFCFVPLEKIVNLKKFLCFCQTIFFLRI